MLPRMAVGGNQVTREWTSRVTALAEAGTINPLIVAAHIGWLAGIVDGEGTIYVHRNRQYRLVVVVNTDLDLLRDVQRRLDAIGVRWKMYEHKQNQRDWFRRKTRYDIHVYSTAADELCKILRPMLSRRKRKRATCVLRRRPTAGV